MNQTIPLTAEQIRSVCQRGFGTRIQIESTQELGGGTFNTAYLIAFTDASRVILRVAPLQTTDTAWEDAFLMRSEYAMQPFFAPITARMPKTLFIDFTHQILDRDYMFQTFIEGERWDDAREKLTAGENNSLWSQFGHIMRQIHDVRGERFGLPRPGFQFERWSQTVIGRLERTLQAARGLQLDVTDLARILEIISVHPKPLDEIQFPRLLHGDLWLFNILINEKTRNPPSLASSMPTGRGGVTPWQTGRCSSWRTPRKRKDMLTSGRHMGCQRG